MAEFGIQATELSAPQGAGSSPVNPVQVDQSGFMKTVAEGLNIFAKGLGIKAKEEADQQRNMVVGSFIKKQQAINEGFRTGQINPSEAQSRSRALFGEYAAGYSQYVEDIDKAAKSLRGFTELGDAEKAVESAAALRQQSKTAAQASGYSFYSFMTPTQEDSQIQAHQAEVRADRELAQFYRSQEELRAQGRYSSEVSARQQKEMSVRLINDVVDKNFEASYQHITSLSDAVKSGKISFDNAKQEWSLKVGRINAQLQTLAGTNPELAAPYRSLFDRLSTMGEQMLDPTTRTKALENEVALLLNQAKLSVLQKPNIATIVASSQLMGSNAELALRASPAMAQAISSMVSTPVETSAGATPVIGNKEIEKDSLNFLKKSVSDLTSGKFKDNVQAATEAKNAVDNILQQVGNSLGGRGVDASYLKEAAAFFASPEFGAYRAKFPNDIEALNAATKTFQIQYAPTVIDGINKEIDRVVKTTTGLVTARAASGAKLGEGTAAKFDPSKVEIKFNGTGVAFQFKNPSTNPVEARMEQEVISQLRNSTQAINQLVRIGAHMEGTTNYAQFWEKAKSTILPRFFQGEKSSEIPGEGTLKFATEEDAKVSAAFSPEELKPDTPENLERRRKEDIDTIKKELARKDISPLAKRILEEELAKKEKG